MSATFAHVWLLLVFIILNCAMITRVGNAATYGKVTKDGPAFICAIILTAEVIFLTIVALYVANTGKTWVWF